MQLGKNFFLIFKIVFCFLLITSFFNESKALVKKNEVPAVLVDDSLKFSSVWSKPKKATLMSTFLPGLGQVYNKRYWKVPVIYSAFAAAGYFIFSNQKKYLDFKNAIVYRYDNVPGNETYSLYTVDNLVTLKRTYRRYRDFSILGASLIYALQIVDANVDAHLYEFDVDSISLSFRPEFGILAEKKIGLTILIRF